MIVSPSTILVNLTVLFWDDPGDQGNVLKVVPVFKRRGYNFPLDFLLPKIVTTPVLLITTFTIGVAALPLIVQIAGTDPPSTFAYGYNGLICTKTLNNKRIYFVISHNIKYSQL